MTINASRFGANASFVESLYVQWCADPSSVGEQWAQFFAQEAKSNGSAVAVAATTTSNGNGHNGHSNGNTVVASSAKVDSTPVNPIIVEVPAATPAAVAAAPVAKADEKPVTKPLNMGASVGPNDKAEALRGIAGKIVENMETSLTIPTAMSTRVVPVKVLDENRRVINSYLGEEALPRASFTHIIAWALVKAAQKVPSLNNGFALQNGQATKVVRPDVNIGLAIDLPARGGGRTLVVPNIKAAQKHNFRSFLDAYNDIIARARDNKLQASDFADTTITLTNPGGIGTVASSPRLMLGQGAIIATGSIGYPAEYEATAPETLVALGVGKVMTITSTYDHRIVQGAESGAFLQYVHELLRGEHGFYDEVFQSLRIPHHPYRLQNDRAVLAAGTMADGEKAMRVQQLITAFRARGALLAHTDPLDLKPRSHPELNLDNYGLTIWDLDRPFATMGVLPKPAAPLRDILDKLRDTYCRRMGAEYTYIDDVERRRWLQERLESKEDALNVEEKRHVLRKLTEAQNFERFLHKRYMGQKRFSVEGAESVIPMLTEVLATAASHGVTDAIFGMAHRGRLNVLTNLIGKSYEAVFAEFEDMDPRTVQGSGDVKYHLGARGTFRWNGIAADSGKKDEREVRIELACNPSHLEAVDPVVLGQCRARQDLLGDLERHHVMPVLIHGDAAFAGQGVVYEALQMAGLQGYRVGGCIHVVINNQIGYTTGPERARTSTNCTDVARVIQAPVFRVNGDDPEACVRAARIATEYRQKFGGDVVIDMVCYRRHGHNEGDEPSFTQPILYKAIERHKPTRDQYAELLVRRKDLKQGDVDEIERLVAERFENAFNALRSRGNDAVPERNIVPKIFEVTEENPHTAVDADTLKRITERITYDPDVIELHPRLKKNVLDTRHKAVFVGKENGGPGIDFGLAENLAFGSLLLESIPVRISGQDCGRGTFAHRHAVLYDVNDGRPYIPLNYLNKSRDEGEAAWTPSRFRIYDALLSEEAVLGFEYGYSVTHPNSLVLWEAQFGDFFNGAQVYLDQYISAGEAKWNQQSRVVLMLPHGYDGQGPEHSSARIERFLQLCAEDNMRLAIATTPAQHFHLLRRQAKQPRKPLVIFTHKSLLRAEDASSTLADLTSGQFMNVLDDPRRICGADKMTAQGTGKACRRLVLCSGKVYWDIDRERVKVGKEKPGLFDQVAVARVEQLYPFPEKEIRALVDAIQPDEVVWVQEEPRNMGAWFFMEDRLRRMNLKPRYVGRAEAASPAVGSHKRHHHEQHALIDGALYLDSNPHGASHAHA